MKLYEYWLGLYPLDWEFCFMPVQTYTNLELESLKLVAVLLIERILLYASANL